MNQVVRRGPIAAFFVGVWDVMNFTRRLILNFLFFGLLFLCLALFLVVVGRGNGVKPTLERTTLVIAPEGRLVEQYTSDPATRALAKAFGDKSAEEIQLRDLVRAIDAAKDDKNIERVLLRVDQLQLCFEEAVFRIQNSQVIGVTVVKLHARQVGVGLECPDLLLAGAYQFAV